LTGTLVARNLDIQTTCSPATVGQSDNFSRSYTVEKRGNGKRET